MSGIYTLNNALNPSKVVCSPEWHNTANHESSLKIGRQCNRAL